MNNGILVDKDVYIEFRKALENDVFILDSNYMLRSRTLRLLKNAEQKVLDVKATIANEKLDAALKECRKELDIYARKSFACCDSCGSYELSGQCKKTGKKGFLFYSRKSKDDLAKGGEVYFNFSAFSQNGNFSYHDDTETEKMGKKIVMIFKKNGLNVEWDGSINTAILVKV